MLLSWFIPLQIFTLIIPYIINVRITNIITIQIDGTIVAPAEPDNWDPKLARIWLDFSKLNGVLFQGSGVIDGSGSKWWASSCKKNKSNVIILNSHISSIPCNSIWEVYYWHISFFFSSCLLTALQRSTDSEHLPSLNYISHIPKKKFTKCIFGLKLPNYSHYWDLR